MGSLAKAWTELKSRFFGFHRDHPPAAVAQNLGGHVVFSERKQGQWIAVIEMVQGEMQNAEVKISSQFSVLSSQFSRELKPRCQI